MINQSIRDIAEALADIKAVAVADKDTRIGCDVCNTTRKPLYMQRINPDNYHILCKLCVPVVNKEVRRVEEGF